jgi:hypothetical protein
MYAITTGDNYTIPVCIYTCWTHGMWACPIRRATGLTMMCVLRCGGVLIMAKERVARTSRDPGGERVFTVVN